MPAWVKSIRSLVALAVVLTFCYLAVTKGIDAKDVVAVTIIILNFYFLGKKREEEPKP